jgi:hypothetical protein
MSFSPMSLLRRKRYKQEVLIKQLQEQHYQQYMQRVYQQQLLHQQQQYQQLQAIANTPDGQQEAAADMADGGASSDYTQQPLVPVSQGSINQMLQLQSETVNGTDHTADHLNNGLADGAENDADEEEDDEEENENDQNDLPPIAAASMWTRKDLTEFKDSIRKDPDSVIKVGSGETVTVSIALRFR